MATEIYGIITKNEFGYSLWIDTGFSKEENSTIQGILDNHDTDGSSTSPCSTIQELLTELQEIYKTEGK